MTPFNTYGAFSGGLAIYGDGSDGDVVIAVDTSLARDMFYDNLTVNAGVTLNTNGFRVFCKTGVKNFGIISHDGNTGGNGGNAAAGAGGAPGTAATIINTGTLVTTKPTAGAGVIGANGPAAGGTGVAAGTNPVCSLGGAGGAGGAGGDVITPNPFALGPGGNAGTVTAPTAPNGLFNAAPMAVLMKVLDPTVIRVNGGASGGGGGSGAAGPDANTTSGGGGGGGTGGGIVVVCAKNIDNSTGIIRANGGAGGNAGAGFLNGVNRCTAGSGGGGGGGGGVVVLVYSTLTAGTEEAVGGAGGAKSIKLVNGTGTGNDGSDGAAGAAGTVIKIQN
jgi:hypothetical protein